MKHEVLKYICEKKLQTLNETPETSADTFENNSSDDEHYNTATIDPLPTDTVVAPHRPYVHLDLLHGLHQGQEL